MAIDQNAPKTMPFRRNPHSFHEIPPSFYQLVSAERAFSGLALSIDFD